MNQQQRPKHLVVQVTAILGVTGALLFFGLRHYSERTPIMESEVAQAAQEKDPDFQPGRAAPAFKPITEVPVKLIREARNALNPSELVIGVTVGKESRAYPINMLTGPLREILNDTLGGKAIAATW